MSAEITSELEEEEEIRKKTIMARIELSEDRREHLLFYGHYLSRPLVDGKEYVLVFSGNENSDTIEKIHLVKEKFAIKSVFLFKDGVIEEGHP